ncbi:MAG: 23S rRNA (guanosine(2251)-2'-O)-methyltransferase RlmB [Thermodesulfobacteriota bacterium]|nr:23S rRNA (guanosine(2251)-2'-O)-methyltransferase RlmB [Thermodesulfobacteriota bacterium]
MASIVYGINPIAELLKSNRYDVVRIFYARSLTGARIKAVLGLAEKKGISIIKTDRENLSRIAGTTKHQGIAASCEKTYQYCTLEDIIFAWKNSGENSFFLILDHIQDPHNFGALIRTAHLAGVHGIIIPSKRACEITPAVIKASSGAIFHTRICKTTNISRIVDYLKGEKIWIAGSVSSGGTSLYSFDGRDNIGLVIGNEEKGISALVQKKCDFLIRIPMRGRIDALNASVAGGIILFEVFRQRLPGKEKI